MAQHEKADGTRQRSHLRWMAVGVALTLSALAGLMVIASPRARVTAAGSFSFTAVGDYNATSNTDLVLGGIANSGASFNLALGDLSYGALMPETAWCDYVKGKVGATFPFQLVAGNHDADGQTTGHIDNFAACLPDHTGGVNGTYGKEYYFDYQNLARVIMLSPNLTLDGQAYDYTAGNAHYNWVAAAIDGARSASIPWVIVGMHKNCITIGVKSCEIGADLMNLLIAKKVDLVLQGHDHTYERSKQLALGAGCAAVAPNVYNVQCVKDDGADNTYIKGAGSVLTIVGVGGSSLYQTNPADPEAGYFAAAFGMNGLPRFGFLRVDVSESALGAQFVGVGTASTYTDGYTVTASGAPTPTTIWTSTPPNSPTESRTPIRTRTPTRTKTTAWTSTPPNTATATLTQTRTRTRTKTPTVVWTSTPPNSPTESRTPTRTRTPAAKTATLTRTPTRTVASPNGLTGTFFDNADLTNPKLTRIDPKINFNWGTGSPQASIAVDTFSVRWNGQVQVPAAGKWTFYVLADDGARLWINNHLVVDNWGTNPGTEVTGALTLSAGTYPLKLEYFENTANARVGLQWSGPGIVKQVIPNTRLLPQ